MAEAQENPSQPTVPEPTDILVGAGLAFLAGVAATLGCKVAEELWQKAMDRMNGEA